MLLYYNPKGDKIPRSEFIGLGGSLGFAYEQKSR